MKVNFKFFIINFDQNNFGLNQYLDAINKYSDIFSFDYMKGPSL